MVVNSVDQLQLAEYLRANAYSANAIMPIVVGAPGTIPKSLEKKPKLETVSIAEPLQNRQHAQNL